MQNNEHESEWLFLQNQFESYEKHSLFIKLVSILVLFASLVVDVNTLMVALLLLVLWLQDAIWKTFQSRIEPRLFQLEVCIRGESNEPAFQFNTEYEKSSLGGVALIGEYVRQAIRPTIAYPHVVLLFILLSRCLLN